MVVLNAAISATLAFQNSERGSLPYGFGIFSDVKNTYSTSKEKKGGSEEEREK
jgi:hypothetical protein